MLRGKVFGRAGVYAGLVGFGLLLVHDVRTSFMPGSRPVAMVLAMAGGLATIAWNILVARRLFQLGRGVS